MLRLFSRRRSDRLSRQFDNQVLLASTIACLFLTACTVKYDSAYSDNADRNEATEFGSQLFEMYGCMTCHYDNNRGIAPSLVNKRGSVVFLSDGGKSTWDSEYIMESIAEPWKKSRQGFISNMPTFNLSRDEVKELTSYVLLLAGTNDD